MAPSDQEPDYGAWMERYGPILRRYFLRRVPEDDADDLVQDVFLRIQAAQSETPVENVESYLFTTACHVTASYHREQSARKTSQHVELTESAEIVDLHSPERIVIGFEEFERALTIISNLPPRARRAFELHRLDELTYRAIGERMGIKTSSVKELVHRAAVRIWKEMESSR